MSKLFYILVPITTILAKLEVDEKYGIPDPAKTATEKPKEGLWGNCCRAA